MRISYTRLWKLLIDKKMNKTELRDAAGISNSTLARLSKNEPVSMEAIGRICACLDCRVEDVLEFIPDVAIEKEFM